MSTKNLDTALRYLRALEERADGPSLAAFFHPSVSFHEYPNRLHPTGGSADLEQALAASETGKRRVASQRYEVRHALAEGDHVALELDWSATLAEPVAQLPAGAIMRAYLGVFLKFEEGRIISQHNYDCYEPF
jgi:hypothetical protein